MMATDCPGVAVFDLATFLARYPEFSSVSASLLQSYFSEAGLYLNNTPCSIVCNVATRLILLNMLTAHIAFLGGALTADNQPRPVGRVSQASEGTVSASFEMNSATPGSGAWFAQSQYGAAFWQATTQYRGARYSPQPTRVEGFTGTGLGRGFLPTLKQF
jgi:Protein of unknown function (DUF4054)